MSKSFNFITFEGPDGSGKTTLAQAFFEWLSAQGVDVILTREPGGKGNHVAEAIRELVLDRKDLPIAAITEALLFAASRAQHVKDLIVPALAENKVVICDRYIDSSLAYQGFARHLGIDKVYQINQFATNGLLPDLTFFIDIPYEVGLARIKQGNRKSDRLDEETTTMHKLVYDGYQEIIKKWPERFIIINGDQPFQMVFDAIKEAFKPYLDGMKLMLFIDYLKQTKTSKSFINSLIVQTTYCCNYKDLAKQYLKTMVCSSGNPYCDSCHVCQKINADQYIDFIYIDNDNGDILKEDALAIQRIFSSGATEPSGVKLYVIKNLELANKFVLNSLLKFIEDPPKQTYALFLTNNSQKIIGTIRSRSQMIHITDSIQNFEHIDDEQTTALFKSVFIDYNEYLNYIKEFDINKIISLVNQTITKKTTVQEVQCFNLIKDLEKEELNVFIKLLIQKVNPRNKLVLLDLQQNLKLNLNKKLLVLNLLKACK